MTMVMGSNCFTGAHGDVRWLRQLFVSLFVVCLRMVRGESLRSDVRCRDKPLPARGAAAVGHSFAVSRQAVPGEVGGRCRAPEVHSRCVPIGESPMGKLCLRGRPSSGGQLATVFPGQGPDRCWTASRAYE